MSDLLEEANIDYKDQWRIQLFRKLLPYIAFGTLLLVFILGVNNYLNEKALHNKMDRTTLLIESATTKLELSELSDEVLNKLSQENDGVGDIAKITKINNLISQKNYVDALNLTENLIDNSSLNITKNFAKNLYVSLTLDNFPLDDKTLTKLKNYVTSIDKTQPLYYNTRIVYCLMLIKTEKYNDASKEIKEILNEKQLTQSLKNQALAIQNYLELKGVE